MCFLTECNLCVLCVSMYCMKIKYVRRFHQVHIFRPEAKLMWTQVQVQRPVQVRQSMKMITIWAITKCHKHKPLMKSHKPKPFNSKLSHKSFSRPMSLMCKRLRCDHVPCKPYVSNFHSNFNAMISGWYVFHLNVNHICNTDILMHELKSNHFYSISNTHIQFIVIWIRCTFHCMTHRSSPTAHKRTRTIGFCAHKSHEHTIPLAGCMDQWTTQWTTTKSTTLHAHIHDRTVHSGAKASRSSHIHVSHQTIPNPSLSTSRFA